MAGAGASRRLIFNADDFGASPSHNTAVIEAHDRGVLTTASLLVNGPGFAEAVDLAARRPRLGVGLHLALIQSASTLPAHRLPGLVDARGCFRTHPFFTGWRYYFDGRLRPQLEAEMDAQFSRFHATGLVLDHVNGHLNLHLHPVIFDLLLTHRIRWGLTRFRLVRDPLWHNLRLARGPLFSRIAHAVTFGALSRRAAPRLAAAGIRHSSSVYGLLQNGRVDEDFLLRLLPSLPPGDHEVYSHPDLVHAPHEFEALVSPRVKQQVTDLGIQTLRYQDL